MKRARAAYVFAEREGGPFLREEGVKRIPPGQLPNCFLRPEHAYGETGYEEDLRLLFAPGSSLSAAPRPKASASLRRMAISRLQSFRKG